MSHRFSFMFLALVFLFVSSGCSDSAESTDRDDGGATASPSPTAVPVERTCGTPVDFSHVYPFSQKGEYCILGTVTLPEPVTSKTLLVLTWSTHDGAEQNVIRTFPIELLGAKFTFMLTQAPSHRDEFGQRTRIPYRVRAFVDLDLDWAPDANELQGFYDGSVDAPIYEFERANPIYLDHGSVMNADFGLNRPGTTLTPTPTPTPMPTPEPSARAVYVAGSTAYVGFSNFELHIVDVGDPSGPSLLSRMSVSYIKDIDVDGTKAYVASGLHVIDVRDRASPQETGALPYLFASTLDAENDRVYLNSWEDLIVVDAADPANPAEIGRETLAGWIQDIDVVGGTAFIAESSISCGPDRLTMVDVSDPAHPTSLASVPVDGNIGSVHVVGTRAYVASLSSSCSSGGVVYPPLPGGLHIFDITDPASPVQLGSDPISSAHLFVAGAVAYALTFSHLVVIDVSDPILPVALGELALPAPFPKGIFVLGDYAYVADSEAGLQIVDVRDPANLTIVGQYDL